MPGVIITIAQQKGGSGKTTVAPHLEVALGTRDKSVAIVDVDPQGSLGEWFERREARLGEEAIDLEFRTASGWGARREARNLARHHDFVVVDTPPKSDIEMRPAIEAADLVVVPLQPTPVDLWATSPTLQMIAKEGNNALLVLNRVVRRALLSAEMEAAARELGYRLAKSQLGNRVAYPSSMGSGSTVIEFEPSGLAAEEVRALAKEIRKQVRTA
jgi:chromosome partitioning protein